MMSKYYLTKVVAITVQISQPDWDFIGLMIPSLRCNWWLQLSLFPIEGTADKEYMNDNVFEREFVLKLCFQINSHGDGLSLMSSAIRQSSASQEHLSSDELETLLMNHANADAVERAEQHLLFCEQCLDAAVGTEIELAAIRRALY
jgi:hypothetical protein